jgi:dTDP-4-amino-4,6-dideoxy-D-galactose acyltransferase
MRELDASVPVTHLDWDTEFFGFKVARVDDPYLAATTLGPLLEELRSQEVKLVYWSSNQELEEGVVRQLSGALVDAKTTFVADLRDSSVTEPTKAEVAVWAATTSSEELEKLAIQAGEFSRFARDPRIGREKFEALYRLWIQGSVAGKLATTVLVIREKERLAGLVTVGQKGGRGEIGLIAVDSAFRGRGFGRALVRSAQRRSLIEGHTTAQVVTQGANVAACHLYAACGYAVERVEHVYHFWL